MASTGKNWEWIGTQSVDPSYLTRADMEKAYNLDRLGCSVNCKKNCSQKPKCLFHLGEKKWLQEVEDGYWDEVENPEVPVRRPEGESCGLKNLGATCYVNSLLQVLYHNNSLRQAMYTWNPRHDAKEIPFMKSVEEDPDNSLFEPKSPVGHLQSVFARLQFGDSRYVDPTELIKSLDLDVSQQQDAQEFCKLFLNLLEEDLSTQPNDMVKHVVQNEYRGSYDYVTKCLGCSQEKSSPSTFYELTLNIEGNSNVQECLEQFFAQETLEGSNSYKCSTCMKECIATRGIRLQKLPPTLNLQLLRFVYDRSRNARKKLNNEITFPEHLDMSQYVTPSKVNHPSAKYTLSAVLVHVGTSAQSGHYVAHIRDGKTGQWFKFNDERVEKIPGNNLKQCLDDVEVPETKTAHGSSGGESSKSTAGSSKSNNSKKSDVSGDSRNSNGNNKSHSSRNAYMLVYQSKNRTASTDTKWNDLLPVSLREKIAIERSSFDDWGQRFKFNQRYLVQLYKMRQKEIRDFFSKIVVRDQSSCEFIDKHWISTWLKSTPEQLLPPVDNSSLLCPHQKLSLNKTSEFKCVSTEAANIIHEKYTIHPRLTSRDLCELCVQKKVQSYQLQAEIQDDSRLIAELMKYPLTVGQKNYWLGNKSFKNWKQLAQNEADEDDIENLEIDDDESESGTRSNSGSLFNEEILCEHGNLNLDTSCRRKVSGDVWSIFRKYFPSCPEFLSTTESCSDCLATREEEASRKQMEVEKGVQQKSLLVDLFQNKRRPGIEDVAAGQRCFMISPDFLKKWRQFLESPSKNSAPTSINNSSLFCSSHGNLLRPLIDESPVDKDHRLCLLYEWEWDSLREFYPADHTICVQRVPDVKQQDKKLKMITDAGDGIIMWKSISTSGSSSTDVQHASSQEICDNNTGDTRVISDPPHCESCYGQFLSDQKAEKLKYVNQHIYVKKIQADGDNDDVKGDPGTTGSTSTRSNSVRSRSPLRTSPSENKNSVGGGKDGPPSPRRSARNPRCRDQKEFTVSSHHTLLQLKVKIMQVFGIVTFDQQLTLRGVKLQNNEKTLAELDVYPESVIYLSVDDTPDVTIDEPKSPERGFQGTRLLGSNA